MSPTHLAYLIAALAFAVPAQQATKYLLQFLKGILPAPTEEPAHSNVTRIYALTLGALVLPALAAAWAYLGYGPAYDVHELPFDVVTGGAAGFAAIADYHLLNALQSMASGTPLLSTVVAGLAAPADPPVAPDPVDSTSRPADPAPAV